MENNNLFHNASPRRSRLMRIRPSVLRGFMLCLSNSLVILSLLFGGLAPSLVQAAAPEINIRPDSSTQRYGSEAGSILTPEADNQ